MGCNKNISRKEIHVNTILPQEKQKHQIENLTLHLKQTGKTNKQTNKKNRKNPKLLEGNKLCRSQQK